VVGAPRRLEQQRARRQRQADAALVGVEHALGRLAFVELEATRLRHQEVAGLVGDALLEARDELLLRRDARIGEQVEQRVTASALARTLDRGGIGHAGRGQESGDAGAVGVAQRVQTPLPEEQVRRLLLVADREHAVLARALQVLEETGEVEGRQVSLEAHGVGPRGPVWSCLRNPGVPELTRTRFPVAGPSDPRSAPAASASETRLLSRRRRGHVAPVSTRGAGEPR
jgi:hypothetical protein